MVHPIFKVYYDNLFTIYLENQDLMLDFVGALTYFSILIKSHSSNLVVCRWNSYRLIPNEFDLGG
jgi:hypothetical protein